MRRPSLPRWPWRGTSLAAAIAAATILGCNVYQRGAASRSQDIAREIEVALQGSSVPEDAPRPDKRTRTLLLAFYEARDMQPAWTTGRGLTSQARALVEVLQKAENEGLNPEHYAAATLAARRKEVDDDPHVLAETDVLCTASAFQYMSDLFDGRISPRLLDAKWATTPRKGDLDSILTHALEKNRVKQTMAELAPAHEGYRELREAREKYAKIVEDGGWAPVPPGGTLQKGQDDPRVAILRARMIASGDLSSKRLGAADANHFDDDLEAAVQRVQERYGRNPDGVVGASELAELNVPAEERLRQIELNMERWRWLPKSFGERYLIVNIPEYVLRLSENEKTALEMRVVVGKTVSATPVFSDSLTYIVINPNWNIPESIVVDEIAPALNEDSAYLTKNRMRIFEGPDEGAKEIDAGSIDWSDSASVTGISVRQDPWEGNSLGRIKFMLPNRFNVYFHDTPAGELFALEERGFSHGCVRVEDPVQLASVLLRGEAEGEPETIRALIESGETKTLTLPHAVPVHIVYFTAFVSENGSAGFREDIYGIDRELSEELRGKEKETGPRTRVANR